MKFRRLVQLSTAIVVGVSSLLLVDPQVVHAAGTDNWTGLAGDNKWSSVTNWDNGAPVTGEDLVFDVSSLSSSTALDNDILGLDLNSISFTGSNSSSFAYTINGDDFGVTAGITDATNVSLDKVNVNITLTGDQTFTNVTFGPSTANVIDLGIFHLSLIDGSYSGSFTGSGTLNVGNDPTSSTTFNTASTNFTGMVQIQGIAIMLDPAVFGTATVTVANGALLTFQTGGSSATISNNLVLSGSGVSNSGALQVVMGAGAGGALTLSGSVTLAGDTVIGNSSSGENETVNFTGTLSKASHALTGLSNVTLSGSALDASNSADAAAAAAAAAAALKSPNTGLALIAANPLITLVVSSVAAAFLLITASRFRRNLKAR